MLLGKRFSKVGGVLRSNTTSQNSCPLSWIHAPDWLWENGKLDVLNQDMIPFVTED